MDRDEPSNPFRPDRDRGILTTADRKLLTGTAGLKDHSERVARQRVRERVREAIFDFRYLADPEYLEDRDLDLIREATDDDGRVVTDRLFRLGEGATENVVLDPAIDEALPELIAFAFRVNPSEIEETVQTGIGRALQRGSMEAEVGDVEIPIEVPDDIAERVEKYIDAGFPLTDTEVRVALEREVRPADEIAEHVREHGTRGDDSLEDRPLSSWYFGAPDDPRDG
jgi:hypothetical protein